MEQSTTSSSQPLDRLAALACDAAEGWLMLDNPAEALLEIENIPAQDRSHPSVLAVQWRAWTSVGKSKQAWMAARRWCEVRPDSPEAWICQANSLRELRGTQAAADLLLCVVERFPKEPVIPYNLACFSTQEGDLPRACSWLIQAFEIEPDSELKQFALLDPDLKPLWERIGENFTVTVRERASHKKRC